MNTTEFIGGKPGNLIR